MAVGLVRDARHTLASELAGIEPGVAGHWVAIVVSDETGRIHVAGCCERMRDAAPEVLARTGSAMLVHDTSAGRGLRRLLPSRPRRQRLAEGTLREHQHFLDTGGCDGDRGAGAVAEEPWRD